MRLALCVRGWRIKRDSCASILKPPAASLVWKRMAQKDVLDRSDSQSTVSPVSFSCCHFPLNNTSALWWRGILADESSHQTSCCQIKNHNSWLYESIHRGIRHQNGVVMRGCHMLPPQKTANISKTEAR